MLSRFFTVLKKVDSMGKAREQKLIGYLDRKRSRILATIFERLLENKTKRSEKRLQGGLADLKN